jgi:hypothetical protein
MFALLSGMSEIRLPENTSTQFRLAAVISPHLKARAKLGTVVCLIRSFWSRIPLPIWYHSDVAGVLDTAGILTFIGRLSPSRV